MQQETFKLLSWFQSDHKSAVSKFAGLYLYTKGIIYKNIWKYMKMKY